MEEVRHRKQESNLAVVISSRTRPSRAKDRDARTASGVAQSGVVDKKPSRVALETAGASPKRVCPWEDTASSRCKKSKMDMNAPDRALPKTGSVKPRQPMLRINKVGSNLAKSDAAAVKPDQERDCSKGELSGTTESVTSSRKPE